MDLSLLHTISRVMGPDFHVLGPVMKHWIVREADVALIITVNDY